METIKYYDRNMNPLTKDEKNRICDWWDSFRPGFPGYTYPNGRVVMINPNTKEETTMYYKKEIVLGMDGKHKYAEQN